MRLKRCLKTCSTTRFFQRWGSFSHFRLCQQAKHALLEWWKSAWTSPEASSLWTCYCLVMGIIGLYFFDENERALTVNEIRYRDMIEEFFLPSLEETDIRDVRFQQDGATAHTAWDSMDLLRYHFPERLIFLRGDLQIWLHAISFQWVIWNSWFMSIDHGP